MSLGVGVGNLIGCCYLCWRSGAVDGASAANIVTVQSSDPSVLPSQTSRSLSEHVLQEYVYKY